MREEFEAAAPAAAFSGPAALHPRRPDDLAAWRPFSGADRSARPFIAPRRRAQRTADASDAAIQHNCGCIRVCAAAGGRDESSSSPAADHNPASRPRLRKFTAGLASAVMIALCPPDALAAAAPPPAVAADTMYERFMNTRVPEEAAPMRRDWAVEMRYRDLVEQAYRNLRDNFLEQQPRSRTSSMVNWRAVRERAHRRMDEAVAQLQAKQERANVEASEGGLPRYNARAEAILKDATYGAIREMVAGLGDRYTHFFSPSELQGFLKGNNIHGTRGIIGVGMGLSRGAHASGAGAPGAGAARGAWAEREKGRDAPPLVVSALVADSPAEAAGIRVGDEILAIDGAPTSDLTPDEAAMLLRGPTGSEVDVTVARANGPRASFALVRRPMLSEPLVSALLPGPARPDLSAAPSVGYMRLRFVGSVGRRQLPAAVARLEAEGAQGFVIDLRNNPGGVFEEGLEIARFFLDPADGGALLRTVDSRGFRTLFPVDTDTYAGGIPEPPAGSDGTPGTGLLAPAPVLDVPPAAGRPAAAPRLQRAPLTDKPLVVLTNAGTASASEIVAVALRENGRAAIVGERTFGKGLIQYVFRLADGSGMKITVARYETASGGPINGVGVPPDVPCRQPDLLGPAAFSQPDECLQAAVDALDAAIQARGSS